MRYSATRFDPWVVIFMPLNHIKLKLQLQTEIPGYTLPVRRSALFCEFRQPVMAIRGPDSSVGVVIGCGLDGPGIESRWGEIFRTCPDRPWGPPSLLYNRYRVFPGGKSGRSVTLAPHSLLVPWSRKSRAIPLLSLWAVRPVQSIGACTRVHFTFTIFIHPATHLLQNLTVYVLKGGAFYKPIYVWITLGVHSTYAELPIHFNKLQFCGIMLWNT